MSTPTPHPTDDDLRAALLAACAEAGHPATLDERGDHLTFTADGASVPVRVEAAYRTFSGKAVLASIVFARFSERSRRFCPRSGRFDWPIVAQTAREIANALRAERAREEER